MAKLKAVVDKLDAVPQAFRELYTEGEDGKYHLDADGVEDVTGLKTALDKERKRARDFEKRVKDIPEDFDPEDYAALRKLREEQQKGQLTDKQREEFESLKKQLHDAHSKELAKRDDRIKALVAALETEMITAQATGAIAAAQGSVKLLLPHVRRQAKVIEEQGAFRPVVVGEDGHPRLKGDKEMTYEDLVAEMKEQDDFAGAFAGSGASGIGALGSRGAGGSKPSFEDIVKNPTAAIAAANASGKK